uniref:Hexosyltransferase n=1 Tax=Acrobeloides nanus TaxID=290746 RepID=A0A914CHR1_9BILA
MVAMTRRNIRVSQEANKYQDVLLLDYHESYYNVSRKVFGYFRYVYDHCPNVKCVLKGDSDAIMNLSGMEKLCDVLPDEQYLVTGRRIFEPEPDRVPWTKHYVPYFVWPDNYPPFVFGFSYMFSGYGVIPKLLVTLQQETPFLNSENYRRLPED